MNCCVARNTKRNDIQRLCVVGVVVVCCLGGAVGAGLSGYAWDFSLLDSPVHSGYGSDSFWMIGAVIGGGALVRALSAVADMKGDNEDQNVGIAIACRAMEEPLRQIVGNAGEEGSVVLNNVKQGEGNYGYNAATGEYADMIEAGILDPTKVARSALQNAASVAGLMITTEAMVADMPADDSAPAGGMPDMSGMGGMGGMGGMM